jgi:hypothetical protein
MRKMAVLLLAAFLLAAAAPAQEPEKAAPAGDAARAQELLKAARAALGGEAKLAAVKSLSISGVRTLQSPRGGLEGELKMDFQLPDKYRRTTSTAFGGNQISSSEIVNGADAGVEVSNPGGAAGGPGGAVVRGPGGQGGPGGGRAPDPARQRRMLQDEYARVLMAILLTSSSHVPLEFFYTGEGEVNGEPCHVLEMKTADRVLGQLLLDANSNQPRAIRWRGFGGGGMVFRGPGGGGEQRREPPKQGETPPQPREVPIELQITAYREVDGIQFPSQIMRVVDGEVREEWLLTRYKLNPALKPAQFEIKKQQ